MKNFIYNNSWFDNKYAVLSARRHPTFKAALNMFLQNGGTTIVETGCCRLPDDWGAGMSTVLLGDVCRNSFARMHTVDLSPINMQTCKNLTNEYANNITYHIQDSVTFLEAFTDKIDLLYLDSFDYPYGELLNAYGGRTNIEEAIVKLKSMSDEDIVSKHLDIIKDSQMHCLNELLAAIPKLSEGAPILIDDCDLPGGGKGRIAKDWLLDNGYMCVLDMYQSLWVKR